RRISAASRSARALTSDEDGATGASVVIEGDPAGQLPQDPADAPGVHTDFVRDLLARVPVPPQVQDRPVFRRADRKQALPRRPGPGVLARPRLGAGELAAG